MIRLPILAVVVSVVAGLLPFVSAQDKKPDTWDEDELARWEKKAGDLVKENPGTVVEAKVGRYLYFYRDGKLQGRFVVWREIDAAKQKEIESSSKTKEEIEAKIPKLFEGEYKEGKRHGKFTYWDAGGRPTSRDYQDGKLVVKKSGTTTADDKPPAIKVVENITVVRGTIDGKPVAWFNDGQLYAISMNMKLPKAEELKKSLLATLAQNKEHRDKLLFSPFTPADKAPELVEVAIGRSVPKEVVQAVLSELNKGADLKLALSIMSEDGQGLATREVYIGGLVKSGKKAITAEKLKALLDPKLTQADLLDKIQQYDKP